MQNKPRLLAVLLKATTLFVLFNFAFIALRDVPLGKFTLYNSVFPGRERFPFGERREAYNLSIFDLDAMFASHVIDDAEKSPDEYRVLLIGDSSVWGTLLTPEKTLAGQINASNSTACGKNVRTYNLGYPYISLAQQILILDQALQYQPDMVVWLITLESLPKDKQFGSPLVSNNPDRMREIITKYNLDLDPNELPDSSNEGQTFLDRRREIADLVRLQINGMAWTATSIDQYYPTDYQRAQIDLEEDARFHELEQGTPLQDVLSYDILNAGMTAAHIPTILVNEPILISNGLNSDIRYNFFYPRWAFDEYRQYLSEYSASQGWHYIDLWDLVPMEEFTNSGVHLTPYGESLLAAEVSTAIQQTCK